MAAQPALAVKEVVRFPGSVGFPTDPFEYRTGPPIDLFEYRWRRALLQVCVVPACPFWGWGQNGRDLHPIHWYRWWRGVLKGGVVPTTPTREFYVQGSQEHQLPGSNPRTGRLKTTALTIGPCLSLARYGVSIAYGVRS